MLRTAMGRTRSWLRERPLLVPRPGRAWYVSALMLALLAAGAGTQIAVAEITALPADAALRVEDTVITEQQLADRVQAFKALYGVQRPDDPAAVERFDRDAAKAVAVSEILERAAQEEGIVIPEKAAQDELDRLVADAYPAGRDDFITRLGQVGLSEPEVLAEIRRQLTNSRLFDQVTRDVPETTDADVQQAYDARRDEMVDPEKRHVRNIVVGSEAEARQTLDRLNTGEDFAAVARDVSLDRSTKDKGGDLGTAVREQLDPRYADEAFRVSPNSFFGPLETQHGWNVGQVLAVTPAVPLSLDQVRDPLRQKLTAERKLDRWNAWLGGRIQAAGVEYAPHYRPADPDVPPVDLPR
ncbi:peptidyl-prolyl cis-trans isomerase [Pseudonocardia bannensis]|nr:peptidyl-prolyl cis-trans isomerase [Pseudonocardia bannensis]